MTAEGVKPPPTPPVLRTTSPYGASSEAKHPHSLRRMFSVEALRVEPLLQGEVLR